MKMSSKMSTPEKIETAISVMNEELETIEDSFSTIRSESEQIYESLSKTLEIFDDLPIDRMRKIKPYLENARSAKDQMISSSESLESYSKVLLNARKSVEELRSYFEDVYMQTVRDRENRSHKDR